MWNLQLQMRSLRFFFEMICPHALNPLSLRVVSLRKISEKERRRIWSDTVSMRGNSGGGNDIERRNPNSLTENQPTAHGTKSSWNWKKNLHWRFSFELWLVVVSEVIIQKNLARCKKNPTYSNESRVFKNTNWIFKSLEAVPTDSRLEGRWIVWISMKTLAGFLRWRIPRPLGWLHRMKNGGDGNICTVSKW